MHWGEIVASLLAGAALLASVVATVVAVLARKDSRTANEIAAESNRISQAARDDGKLARINEAWDEALLALSNLVTFDPTSDSEQVRPLLNAVRGRFNLLVDLLTWDVLGEWLQAEMQRGLALATQAALTIPVGGASVDQRLQVSAPFNMWASVFSNNLRLVRQSEKQFAEINMRSLIDIAVRARAKVYADNGWGEPPIGMPWATTIGAAEHGNDPADPD